MYDIDVVDVEYEGKKIGIPYLIMEYVEGMTLKDILKEKKPLDLKTIFKISEDILSALTDIHKKNVIHRDIKPRNIMIEKESGKALLIDFGLAKDVLSEKELTGSGIIIGTPAYMSPEQFKTPKDLDVTTDIYSFGIVLYEMVTGEPLFESENPAEIMFCHFHEPVPNVRDKNFDLPTNFENIVFKALAKTASARYRSANEFLNALKDLEKDLEEEPKKEDKPKISLKKLLIYLFVVLGIVIAVFIVINPYKSQGQYEQLISHAKESIQNKDYETAIGYLAKAKAIKDTEEIKSLLAEITNERISAMKADFDDLKAFLSGKASNKDKIGKCQDFLNKNQTVPDNDERTSMVSETNNFIKQLQAEIGKDEQYQQYIDAAKEYIKNEEYQKAIDELEKAEKLWEMEEISSLLKKIREKQIEIMKQDFNNLKQFLEGDATKKEKLDKCQKFLERHKNTLGNKAMFDIANQFISQINADLRTDERYQRYLDNVNDLIKNGDYQRADNELKKVRDIKDTDEVKQLSMTISKGLDAERKNGDKEYNTIKDNLDLSKYLAFKRKYRDSIYLLDLGNRLKIVDRNLPPEKYWENPIEKNKKGYYELTFGREHNGHHMIFIPEKQIWIDKYEVSWAQFRKFIMDAKIQFPPIEDDKFIRSGDEYPAVIPYEYAQKYCQKYGLRLPRVDEWEYAAGGGRNTYPWGNASPDKPGTNGNWMANFDSLEGTVEKYRFDGTAPVNSFDKFSSPFGVVNMAGNVWEWVRGNILKGGGFFSSIEDLKIKSS
jgi:serine/threonine protein kinase